MVEVVLVLEDLQPCVDVRRVVVLLRIIRDLVRCPRARRDDESHVEERARPLLHVTLIVPAGTWTPNKVTYDAQQHHYPAYIDAGLEVFEYQNHFNHLKLATFDMRWVIAGSANLNVRSLEDDKDFEACVLIESEELARDIDRKVRVKDIRWSRRIAPKDVKGPSLHALRVRVRGPRTLMMIAARQL